MHFGDRQTDRLTDKLTDKQMDSSDALSRSRCRERRLNNMMVFLATVVIFTVIIHRKLNYAEVTKYV